MSGQVSGEARYFERLGQAVDTGWRQFWFTPRDARGVSALRIVAGLMSLYYLITFSFDLILWFGPNGLLNRTTVERLTTGFGQISVFRFSPFQLSDHPGFLWAVHGLAIAIAAAYTAGLYTRVMNVALLILLLGYIHRGPMLTGQLEPVLTMLVAYLCLTPAGAYWSLDARRRAAGQSPDDPAPSVAANIGQRLIQLHLAGFYALIGLSMLGGDTWWMGDAVWWLMAHSESRLINLTGLARSDVGWYAINFATHAIVLVMLLMPVLVWRPLIRPLLIAATTFVWILLALLTGLIGFCLLMILANVAFVDPRRLGAKD